MDEPEWWPVMVDRLPPRLRGPLISTQGWIARALHSSNPNEVCVVLNLLFEQDPFFRTGCHAWVEGPDVLVAVPFMAALGEQHQFAFWPTDTGWVLSEPWVGMVDNFPSYRLAGEFSEYWKDDPQTPTISPLVPGTLGPTEE